jgi:hypothetical protein
MQSVARADVDDYDADTGLYFHTITEQTPRKGSGWGSSFEDTEGYYHAANVFIYDPVKKTGRNLFSKSPGKIVTLIIESEYDSKNRRMKFVGDIDESDGERAIKNNMGIGSARKPSNTFLLETKKCSDAEHCQYEIWKAGKQTGEPQKIVAFPRDDSTTWHFDVKNRVIRVLTESGGTFAVKEFAW